MQTWFLANSVQQGSIPELDLCGIFVVVMEFSEDWVMFFYGRCGNVCIIGQPYAHAQAHCNAVPILPSHQPDGTVGASLAPPSLPDCCVKTVSCVLRLKYSCREDTTSSAGAYLGCYHSRVSHRGTHDCHTVPSTIMGQPLLVARSTL